MIGTQVGTDKRIVKYYIRNYYSFLKFNGVSGSSTYFALLVPHFFR